MRERFGQLGKAILEGALSSLGTLRTEYEVPVADAQSADAYFIPEPGKERERARLGWLGELAREPCHLELLQQTPGPLVVRDNLRKQLGLDHLRALRLAKESGLEQRRPRPPLLRLWQITTGHPSEVVAGYEMKPIAGWPPGFWGCPRLLAMGIVVLRQVPRRRDTLLLRLLGRGRVLRHALEDFNALPLDAPERSAAEHAIIALRVEAVQDPNPDRHTRAILMTMHETYEQWKTRLQTESRNEGLKEGLVGALVQAHERRFGPLAAPLQEALANLVTSETIGDWVVLFGTASAAEIAAAIRRGSPVP